jgi:hypothetical protein
LKVAFGSIVLKNPSIGFSPKNGRFVASALFGVESAYGEARKLTSRQHHAPESGILISDFFNKIDVEPTLQTAVLSASSGRTPAVRQSLF